MNAPETKLAPGLADIEAACKTMAESRDKLRAIVQSMQDEITRSTERYRSRLRRAIDEVANGHAQVLDLVSSAPGLFKKPRSVQFHGVKCGWQKGKGGIAWSDDERVCELVERHFPDQLEALVKTTRKPVAAALAALDVRDLKRLGCSVTDAGDAAFVKPIDTELDKLVKRLIDDATQEPAQ